MNKLLANLFQYILTNILSMFYVPISISMIAQNEMNFVLLLLDFTVCQQWAYNIEPIIIIIAYLYIINKYFTWYWTYVLVLVWMLETHVNSHLHLPINLQNIHLQHRNISSPYLWISCCRLSPCLCQTSPLEVSLSPRRSLQRFP